MASSCRYFSDSMQWTGVYPWQPLSPACVALPSGDITPVRWAVVVSGCHGLQCEYGMPSDRDICFVVGSMACFVTKLSHCNLYFLHAILRLLGMVPY